MDKDVRDNCRDVNNCAICQALDGQACNIEVSLIRVRLNSFDVVLHTYDIYMICHVFFDCRFIQYIVVSVTNALAIWNQIVLLPLIWPPLKHVNCSISMRNVLSAKQHHHLSVAVYRTANRNAIMDHTVSFVLVTVAITCREMIRLYRLHQALHHQWLSSLCCQLSVPSWSHTSRKFSEFYFLCFFFQWFLFGLARWIN